MNPFSGGPGKNFRLFDIIKGSFGHPKKGDEKFLKFVKNRITNRTESLYAPIDRQRINTGASKRKKIPRTISVLKDVQIFGLLVKNAISMKKDFQYPIKTL